MSQDQSDTPALSLVLGMAVSLWKLCKTPLFRDYVHKNFGREIVDTPTFDCLYVAEAEEGSPDAGRIGGIIKSWWQVDDAGARPVDRPVLRDADSTFGFDQRPVIKFFSDGTRILISERLGPGLVLRTVGTMVDTRDGVRLNEATRTVL